MYYHMTLDEIERELRKFPELKPHLVEVLIDEIKNKEEEIEILNQSIDKLNYNLECKENIIKSLKAELDCYKW